MRSSSPRKRTKSSTRKQPKLLGLIVRALDAKKAEDLQVLDVSEISSITDHLVICTGTSEPHLRALRIEIERVLDGEGAAILGMDGGQGSGWLVVDAVDLMVHVFTAENRTKYGLDQLWKDAGRVDTRRLMKQRR
jgi:ribosome-associated protein